MARKEGSPRPSLKGGDYERKFCHELTRWWLNDEDTNERLFWRTASSGGMATKRAKKGQLTSGHCGDIGASEYRGMTLTEVFTIELKRGYNKETFGDLFDIPRHQQRWQIYEEFFTQAMDAAKRADSITWMLVVKRDNRRDLVFFPISVYENLQGCGAFRLQPYPFATIHVPGGGGKVVEAVVMPMEEFFENCSADHVRKLYQLSLDPQ